MRRKYEVQECFRGRPQIHIVSGNFSVGCRRQPRRSTKRAALMLASNSLPMVPRSRNMISGATSNDLSTSARTPCCNVSTSTPLLGLDEEPQHVEAGLRIAHLRLEVGDALIEEHQIFQLGVIDVDAADLEEADGPPRMTHDREDRPGPVAAAPAA